MTAAGQSVPARGDARRLKASRTLSGEAGGIVDYMAYVRRKARNNPAAADPLVAEIVEALLFLGGQAHRDRVAEHIAQVRTGTIEKPSDGLRAHIHSAFDSQLALDRSVRGRPALFDLPFGAGSHRWALAREAHAFLRRGRGTLDPAR